MPTKGCLGCNGKLNAITCVKLTKEGKCPLDLEKEKEEQPSELPRERATRGKK